MTTAKVLGIHGIAQQFTSGPQLTRMWTDALRGGLEAAGLRSTADTLADGDVRVAYFGGLFRPEKAMAGGAPPYTANDVRPGDETELLAALYAEAVRLDPSLGPQPEHMAAGRAAVQVMLDRMARSRTLAGVAQRVFIGDLKQVLRFLHDPVIKELVLTRVHAEVNAQTKVVIGHSLGSVVAYEYLCREAPPSVETLVTIGSPLGIPNMVFDRLTPTPTDGAGSWPRGLSSWVNVSDLNDFVALRKKLSGVFPPLTGRAPVRDLTVDNGSAPHAADRYLNSEQVGHAVGVAM